MEIQVEFGGGKIFQIPLITFGATDWISGVVLQLGDVMLSKDGGAFVDIPLSQLIVVGNTLIITLTLAETQLIYGTIRVIDQTGPKVFADTGVILSTKASEDTLTLFGLIESQRGSHTGEYMIFWNPVNGSNLNSGLTVNEPKKTYNYNGAGGVHSLLVDYGHAIIKGVPATGVDTIVSEYFEMDKPYNFFRGPGKGWKFIPTHNESCAIKTSAKGIQLSGFQCETKATGSQDAICLGSDFGLLEHFWVPFSRGHGVEIDNSSDCIIRMGTIEDAAVGGNTHALQIRGNNSLTTRNKIISMVIQENNQAANTDGIRITGGNAIHNTIMGANPDGLLIHENSGWGINEVSGASETNVIGPRVSIHANTLGSISVSSGSTIVENVEQWGKQGEDGDTLKTLSDQIDTLTAISVLPYPGQFAPPFSTRDEKIEYPRKTENSIPYDLGSNITGYDVNFMAKLNHSDADGDAAILLTDITAGVDDPLIGTGVIPLTASMTNISEGTYYAEVQAVSAGVVVQRWMFRLVIIHNVIDG